MSVAGGAFQFRRELTRKEARDAALAVRQAPLGKKALNFVRPRGVAGLFRSRAPLAIQLRLAAQQGRLVWKSAQAFAVLQAPGHYPPQGGSRWWRFLDRGWDVLLFALPPCFMLGAAAALALLPNLPPWRPIAAIGAAMAAVLYLLVPMTGVVVRGFGWLYRTLVRGRAREVTESGVGQVLASHWSIVLCHLHAAEADTATAELLTTAQARVAEAGSLPGQSGSPHDLLLAEHGITSRQAQKAIRRDRQVDVFTQDPPFLIVRIDHRSLLVLPRPPAKVAGQALLGIPWLLGGMAVVLAVLAEFVASWEVDHCRRWSTERREVECAEQPLQYFDALYWLLNRLSGGDPEGLGVQSAYARTIGLLVTLMSLVIVGIVITALLQQAVTRTQRFGQDVTDAYNESLRTGLPLAHRTHEQSAAIEPPTSERALSTALAAREALQVSERISLRKPAARVLAGFLSGVAFGLILGRRPPLTRNASEVQERQGVKRRGGEGGN